jgi:hypothetical protein
MYLVLKILCVFRSKEWNSVEEFDTHYSRLNAEEDDHVYLVPADIDKFDDDDDDDDTEERRAGRTAVVRPTKKPSAGKDEGIYTPPLLQPPIFQKDRIALSQSLGGEGGDVRNKLDDVPKVSGRDLMSPPSSASSSSSSPSSSTLPRRLKDPTSDTIKSRSSSSPPPLPPHGSTSSPPPRPPERGATSASPPPSLPPPLPSRHRPSTVRGGENDDLDSLTVEQVAQKLKLMGLQDKHVKKFKKNKIDGVLLQVGKAVQYICT